jgi:hypothetical protein
VGFVVDQVALRQVFSEYFGFPCQFSFHYILHAHLSSPSGAGTIDPQVADVPNGLSHPTPRIKQSIAVRGVINEVLVPKEILLTKKKEWLKSFVCVE